MQKLNSKISIRVTKEEKEEIEKLAEELGFTVNFVLRGILNYSVSLMRFKGIDNVSFSKKGLVFKEDK